MVAMSGDAPGGPAGMEVLTRTPGAGVPASNYEKVVLLPEMEDRDPSHHAWADARFAADILAEHALFFVLLMPEELAAKERAEALGFQRSFTDLYDRIVAARLRPWRPSRAPLSTRWSSTRRSTR